MRNVGQLIFSVAVYMLAGYLAGLVVGFTVFDPNLDVYALLALVLAMIGAVLGILPVFRRRANIVLGALVGFYLGTVLAIVLFGSIPHDDLIDALLRGGPGIIGMVIGTVIGGVAGVRLPEQGISLPALGFLMGGFLGGYLFGFVLRIAPSTKMVGIAPFVIGSAILTGGALSLVQKRASPTKPMQ